MRVTQGVNDFHSTLASDRDPIGVDHLQTPNPEGIVVHSSPVISPTHSAVCTMNGLKSMNKKRVLVHRSEYIRRSYILRMGISTTSFQVRTQLHDYHLHRRVTARHLQQMVPFLPF